METILPKDQILVQELINWSKEHSHLPEINEIQAKLFLQKCDNKTEAAKIAIAVYFRFRTSYPDLFSGRLLSNVIFRENLDFLLVTILPKKTPEGYSIIFVKVMDHFDYNKLDILSVMKNVLTIATLSLYEEGASKGYIFAMDVAKVPQQFMSQLQLPAVKHYFDYVENVMPWNFSEIHYFNGSPFINDIVAIVKSKLEKLGKLIYVHETVDGLVEHVPQECLPKDYGGKAESTSVLLANMKKKIAESSDIFEWENQQIVQNI